MLVIPLLLLTFYGLFILAEKYPNMTITKFSLWCSLACLLLCGVISLGGTL